MTQRPGKELLLVGLMILNFHTIVNR